MKLPRVQVPKLLRAPIPVKKLSLEMLPFADAASDDLPLGQLLRLSLFQVSVGMATVLLLGTLNRVMIVELGVPAMVVAAMIALPVLSAPFRALLGFRSDTHRSAIGWKRVPYIWFGSLWQFGGLAIMPFALIVLVRRPDARPDLGRRGAGRARLPDDRPRHAHDPDRRPGARLRPRDRGDPAAGRGAPLRDVPRRHGHLRAGRRRAAGRLLQPAAGPGGAGHRGRDAAPEPRRALEAGAHGADDRGRARRPAPELRRRLGRLRPRRPGRPPARRGGARHRGLLDAGRAARALRRRDPRPQRLGDDAADRDLGAGRHRELRPRGALAGAGAQPLPHGRARPARRASSPSPA